MSTSRRQPTGKQVSDSKMDTKIHPIPYVEGGSNQYHLNILKIFNKNILSAAEKGSIVHFTSLIICKTHHNVQFNNLKLIMKEIKPSEVATKVYRIIMRLKKVHPSRKAVTAKEIHELFEIMISKTLADTELRKTLDVPRDLADWEVEFIKLLSKIEQPTAEEMLKAHAFLNYRPYTDEEVFPTKKPTDTKPASKISARKNIASSNPERKQINPFFIKSPTQHYLPQPLLQTTTSTYHSQTRAQPTYFMSPISVPLVNSEPTTKELELLKENERLKKEVAELKMQVKQLTEIAALQARSSATASHYLTPNYQPQQFQVVIPSPQPISLEPQAQPMLMSFGAGDSYY